MENFQPNLVTNIQNTTWKELSKDGKWSWWHLWLGKCMSLFCVLINILCYIRQFKIWRHTLSVLFCHSLNANQHLCIKWKSKLAREGLWTPSDLSDAKQNLVMLLCSMGCVSTLLNLGQRTTVIRETILWANVKHFSMFYSSLQELWSKLWSKPWHSCFLIF